MNNVYTVIIIATATISVTHEFSLLLCSFLAVGSFATFELVNNNSKAKVSE